VEPERGSVPLRPGTRPSGGENSEVLRLHVPHLGSPPQREEHTPRGGNGATREPAARRTPPFEPRLPPLRVVSCHSSGLLGTLSLQTGKPALSGPEL